MDFEFEKVNFIGNWFHETCTIFRIGIVSAGSHAASLLCSQRWTGRGTHVAEPGKCVGGHGLLVVIGGKWSWGGNAWRARAISVLGWIAWAGMSCWVSLAVCALGWKCVVGHGLLGVIGGMCLGVEICGRAWAAGCHWRYVPWGGNVW